MSAACTCPHCGETDSLMHLGAVDMLPGTTLPMFNMHAALRDVPSDKCSEREDVFNKRDEETRALAHLAAGLWTRKHNRHVFTHGMLTRARDEGEIVVLELIAVAQHCRNSKTSSRILSIMLEACILVAHHGLKGLPPPAFDSNDGMFMGGFVFDMVCKILKSPDGRVSTDWELVDTLIPALVEMRGKAWLEEETKRMERGIGRVTGAKGRG